jgi:hypothetical protein
VGLGAQNTPKRPKWRLCTCLSGPNRPTFRGGYLGDSAAENAHIRAVRPYAASGVHLRMPQFAHLEIKLGSSIAHLDIKSACFALSAGRIYSDIPYSQAPKGTYKK